MLNVFSVYCKIKPLCVVREERDSLEDLAKGCVKICGWDLCTKAFCAGLCGSTKVVSQAEWGGPRSTELRLLCPLFQNEVAPLLRNEATDKYINILYNHIKICLECADRDFKNTRPPNTQNPTYLSFLKLLTAVLWHVWSSTHTFYLTENSSFCFFFFVDVAHIMNYKLWCLSMFFSVFFLLRMGYLSDTVFVY